MLGVSHALTNQFKVLEGEMALDSLCILSLEARKELQIFESRLKEAFVYCVVPSLKLTYFPHSYLLQVL